MIQVAYGPIGLGYRIHRLHLCKGIWPSPNECPAYDIKQSDSEAPVLDIWGNMEYPFIAIAATSTLTRSESTW